MKKLIHLLVGFGVIVPAPISVIACGNKVEDQKETNEDVSELIKALKEETSKIISDFANSKKNKLIGLVNDNTAYNFFSRENIEKYGVNTDQKNNTAKSEMPENIKNDIVSDFNNILKISELENQLNTLATSSDKYNVILLNNKVVEDSNFDKNTIDIKYTNRNWNEEQEFDSSTDYFLSSTVIDLNVKIQYKNQEGIKESFNTNLHLSFTFTNDEVLISIVNDINSKAKSDYLNTDSNYSWLDSKMMEFNIKKDESYKMFDLFDSKKRQNIFSNIYNGEGFKNEIKTFIKNKYLKDINISLEFSENNVTVSKSTINDKMEDKKFSLFKNKTDEQSYKAINNSVFINLEENGNEINFKDYGLKNVNDKLFSLLNKNINIMNDDYKVSFNQFKEANKYTGNYEKSNSFMNGEVTINGLSLKINENYSLSINDFVISYSASIDNSENSDSNNSTMLKDTSFGNAVYFNAVKGIKSFQNVFDTRKTTIVNKNNNTEFNAPIAFSGKVRDNELEENIWDKLQSTASSYTSKMNQSLSLKRGDQINFRDKLLDEGNQSTFEFKMANYREKNESISFNAIYSDLTKQDNGFKQTTRYTGFFERTTAIQMKFNFLNLVFVYEEYNSALSDNSIFIERSTT
ncbi:hypothetical protein [Spiroplasma diminutum]|uniref:Lipoprotein n=1 Tax=Spiroplasma diminutum CUAS-1 TaxID=1276221 RepID=S5MEL3_9MOLU|nr:hypothetical protein [Spiroplasma diminutum]AGR42178.1 hypothetical protein SDIMI_v3c04740 [Spiroplasma diminutum CUAS-1]